MFVSPRSGSIASGFAVAGGIFALFFFGKQKQTF
jgi:hypothetical protein